MDTFTLIEQGLPDLLPPMVRGEGVHVSQVIHSLCIKLGHYDESTELPLTRLQLGLAFEHWIVTNLQQSQPNRYVRIGELTLDGIYGNLDLFDVQEQCVDEIKCTGIAASNDPTSLKFWKYIVQLKAYCKMLGVMKGRLRVCHVGNWNSGDDVPYRVWQCEFSRQSLDENWGVIRNEARRMERTNT